MAKTTLNPNLATLSGRVGIVVYKQYAKGVVVAQAPNMSGVKATEKQRWQRERMKQSGIFYRKVLARPTLREQYAAAAVAKGMSLRNFCTQEYMRQVREPGADLFLQPLPLVGAASAAVALQAAANGANGSSFDRGGEGVAGCRVPRRIELVWVLSAGKGLKGPGTLGARPMGSCRGSRIMT